MSFGINISKQVVKLFAHILADCGWDASSLCSVNQYSLNGRRASCDNASLSVTTWKPKEEEVFVFMPNHAAQNAAAPFLPKLSHAYSSLTKARMKSAQSCFVNNTCPATKIVVLKMTPKKKTEFLYKLLTAWQ